MTAFRVAAIQSEPVMFAKDANIAALLRLTEEAAQNGGRLIVQTEMATTGYCWDSREEIAAQVEPIPGPTTDRFAALAARYDSHIVVGMAEIAPATGIYYNSAALIGPDGLIGVYRKTHAYIAEPKWAKDGDLGLPVFETALGRIAIAICMDASFPETTRIPALAGADVICFPTNWLAEKSPSAAWMARAFESGVYLIAANRFGLERGVQFSGGSSVIDPDGLVQASRDSGEGIIYGEVDPARSRDKRLAPGRSEDKLADRLPYAYGDLTLNTYLWRPHDFHGLYGLRPLPVGRRSDVAVAQLTLEPGNMEANLTRIERAAADNTGVALLVVPELSTCGPLTDAILASRFAESIPGPATAALTAIATRYGMTVVAGIAERDGDRLFNSAVLVGSDGLLGHYRKLHLTESDRAWATPGDLGLPTFDLPVGRVGMLIGYDAVFPEAARSLAIAGADLIAWPSALDWPPVRAGEATAIPLSPPIETGPTAHHFHLWRERSRENETYVALAAATGSTGWSGIFAPRPEGEARGEALVPSTDREGYARFTIDTTEESTHFPTNPVRAKELVGMRMPIWYDALQTPTASLPLDAASRALPVAHGRERRP